MKHIISYLFIGLLLTSSYSCSEFLDVNHDPDAIEEAPIELILPAALASPMYVIGGDGQIIGSYWAQHWTQSTNAPQFQGYDSWQITNATFDGSGYGSLYFNALNDLEYIRKKSKQTGNWSYYLIATSAQSYVYQMLADLYDEIPFTEALQGEVGNGGNQPNITPKFDKGQVVYDSLIVRLDYALSRDFKATTSINPKNSDIVFGGDIEKWKAFANTLKLKIHLRQRFARPEVAQAGIVAMQNELFLENDAAFDIFVDQDDKRNPVYATADVAHKGNISMSRTLMSYLIDNMFTSPDIKDTRVDYLAHRPDRVPEAHRALLQGDFGANSNIDTLQTSPTTILYFGAQDIQYLSRPKLSFDNPLYYFTVAESYLLRAEADLLYWGGANAKTYYENGVRAAFERLKDIGHVDADDDDYDPADVISGYAKWSSASNDDERLELIWMQKWVSMVNIQGLEAFIEHNRTDTPKEFAVNPKDDPLNWDEDYEAGMFTVSVNNVVSNRFPRRLLVPQSELDGNPNVPTTLKTKKIYDRVWWDIQ